MSDRPDLVIDGDGHVIEVNETYERIDPKYRDRRPVYTQVSRGNIVRLVDGKVWGPDTECGFVGVNGNLPAPHGKAIHYRRMGTYNPWARLADMDRDQIDVAVIYPTDELPLTVTHDAGFAAARARAYNDWLYDYCEVRRPGRARTTIGCTTTARCARSGSRASASWRSRTWRVRSRKCAGR